jgi:hypothetical protein
VTFAPPCVVVNKLHVLTLFCTVVKQWLTFGCSNCLTSTCLLNWCKNFALFVESERVTILKNTMQEQWLYRLRTHLMRSCKITIYFHMTTHLGRGLVWRSALLVRRSRDRYPVVSLGTFSEVTDGTMCPGVDSASKYEYQENSWE